MSLKGVVQAACPAGCAASEQEVWSFVRGDVDAELRETLLAGDLNLVRCPECSAIFYAEVPLVYMDSRAALVAFVFPESYRAEEGRWRLQMNEDYEKLRGVFGDALPIEDVPEIFFGMEPLREVLCADDALEDEVLVARHVAEGLGCRMRPVQRAYARTRGLPRVLPSRPWKPGEPFDREGTVAALRALLEANDRLENYRRWLAVVETEGVPPAAREEA
ncbi:MAG: CpXC domain-containing protein [Elusimicrobiota bacterium]|jgi:hypothetical protein